MTGGNITEYGQPNDRCHSCEGRNPHVQSSGFRIPCLVRTGAGECGITAAGSALILVVLLTSILAVVGVLFVMSSRIEAMSTTAIKQEKDLDSAIDSIVTKLADELVLDTPGIAGAEYYDYPGEEDTWLASLEPYNDAGTYKWGRITDLTGYIRGRGWGTQNIEPEIVSERETIRLDQNGGIEDVDPNGGQFADADGDGVADSKWFELEDTSSGTGQALYAAVRVIDNGGMLNVNTAYTFDDNDVSDPNFIDGSKLTQIDLMNVTKGITTTDDPMRIHSKRCNGQTPDLVKYNDECAIRPFYPDRNDVDYLPYDISDELDLRNRFLLDAKDSICRIEQAVPRALKYDGYTGSHTRYVPIDVEDEFFSVSDANNWTSLVNRRMLTTTEDNYDFRHILTVFNTDRIIAPPKDVNSTEPATMFNINPDPDEELDTEAASLNMAQKLYKALVLSIDPDLNLSRPVRRRIKREFAQLAVNLVDLRDRDIDVTSLNLNIDDVGPNSDDFPEDEFIYGIEPFPVVTQVAIQIDANDPCTNPNYYAVELFNPFDDTPDLPTDEFELVITDVNESFDPNDPNTFGSILKRTPIPLNAVMAEDDFHVVYNAEPPVPLNFNIVGSSQQDARMVLSGDYRLVMEPGGSLVPDPCVVNAYNVAVRREVDVREAGADPNAPPGTRYIYLDRQLIPRDWVRWDPNLAEPNQHTRFYGRRFGLDLSVPYDVGWWDVVYPLTQPQSISDTNFAVANFTLGVSEYNSYPIDPNLRPSIDIAVPYGPDRDLATVGDIARIWTTGPTDRLLDPLDADTYDRIAIFDPCALNIDPADPNDPNGRFGSFNQYRRTMGETLRFVSISKDIGNTEDEDLIRLNLGDPYNANIFNYITVFDPRVDGVDNDGDGRGDDEVDEGEKKINGRININTAPRFVLEQLPWMETEIAEAIVAYRDTLDITGGPNYSNKRYQAINGNDELDRYFDPGDIREDKGFASIGELNLVMDKSGGDEYSIRKYRLEPGPWSGFPDLTDAYGQGDKAENDFEERDLIFARISNLVTVRSDIFTAYILVRLGVDGPQKRVIAILDRSDVYNGAGKVKVIALHPVPDAR